MKTILFADDNRNIREFCRQELEDEGYRVVLARDGREAVQVASREAPDLIILDICMPGGGGLEAIEQIKAMRPEVPVIFFTTFDEDCAKDRRGQLATACIEKCEDLREMKLAILRAIAPPNETERYGIGLPPAPAIPRRRLASTHT